MRRRAPLLVALAIASAPSRLQAAPATPVLVERFTSEGGSSRRDHLHIVAFVQERCGRTILGTAMVPLKNARP